MKRRGLSCKCIRCREVRDQKTDLSSARLDVEEYSASDGTEFFISFENEDASILYGFVRLRLSSSAGAGIFPELKRCALIRELHVYGKMKAVGSKKKNEEGAVQHYGFGSKLLEKAEDIACKRGYRKIAVISGVGVRDYYRKKGYLDQDHYLIKKLEGKISNKQFIYGMAVASLIGLAAFLYLMISVMNETGVEINLYNLAVAMWDKLDMFS